MTEQNQRFPSDLQSSQTRILTPGNKLIKRKLCQLQNKAHFFQGQINPLIGQNQKLKAQLTLLNKSVIASTDLLRSLLPIGSDEAKRLKLQLANIEQISEMIKQDWYLMQDQIQRKAFTIDVLEKKIMSNKEQYNSEFFKFKQETEILMKEKDRNIQNLQGKFKIAEQQLINTKQKCQKQINEVKQYFKMRIQRAQKLQRQFQLYGRQVRSKYNEYEKSISRLRDEIGLNMSQFEQSKKNLREIYDKLMCDKLQQQAQGFNILLRTKQQQKDRLMLYYQQKEQQLQKYLNQKSDIIRIFQQQSLKQKQQMLKRQQYLRELNDEISTLKSEIESNENHIKLLNENNLVIENKLKLIEGQMLGKSKYFQDLIQQHKNKFIALQTQLKSKITRLQKQRKQIDEQLKQQSQKLKQTQKSLVTAQRRFNKKLQQQQQKWSTQRLLLEQSNKQLSQTIRQKQLLIQQKLSLIQNLQQKHSKQLEYRQQKRLRQLQQIKVSYEKQITLLRQDASQKFAWYKKQQQRILIQQRIKNNEQLLRSQAQYNKKLKQQSQQFNYIKNNLQYQLNNKQLLIKQKLSLIQSLQIKCYQNEKYITQIKQLHLLQVNKIKNDSKKMLDDLQRIKQQQKKKIQLQMFNQLLNIKLQMDKKQAQYQNTLKKIQYQMMNQINMLKSSNALQQLQSKYKLQISQIQKNHQQQIITMQQKQKQSQQSLIQQQKRRIQQLILQYQQDMTRLAKKLQSDIQNLNVQLFIQHNQHQITKMTRQQKIQYLSKKINQLRLSSEQKQNYILQLQIQIHKFKKQHQRIKLIIQEKVNQRKLQLKIQKNQFMRQCQNNIEKSRLQAQRKVNQIQRDRLQHSQNMFEKFNQLKQLHQNQLKKINNKYNQLQKLFSQRPSRAQDLSKIKQLIQMKQKMDLQMKSYHKKVQHANQIVKYLNLQLENYKDNYDMFGPNDQSNQKTMLIQSSTCQNPIQSIIKLKKINQRKYTQGTDIYSSAQKYQTISPNISNRRVSNDSPTIKQFQLFNGNTMTQSQTLIPPQQINSQSKLGYARRSPQLMNKLKRGKSLDKSGQIVLNAQNFLKLINNNKNTTPSIRQYKSNQRRAYRKSKPRRINTLGLGNG